MNEPTTHTLEVPGVVLTYDVHDSESGDGPVLLMIGSPMGAAGFATLSGHFADRTIVTYDPRGVERSKRTDGATESTPDEHADDLHRLISAVDAGPVDIFATSGGAVNALALVVQHPEQIRTLVAHEPPAAQVLPDREQVLAACIDIHETYLRAGVGPAMAMFFALAGHEGPFPADYAERPAPDPTMFGLPTQDDGSRDDPLVGQNMVSSPAYQHDFDALRAAPTRIVIGVGADSANAMTGRAATAVAERLGTPPVTFPGGHGGFLGGEYGQTGEPDAFAATLRQVLSAGG
jgi:pimeloyl-ACP methyl ester carboxylesterase